MPWQYIGPTNVSGRATDVAPAVRRATRLLVRVQRRPRPVRSGPPVTGAVRMEGTPNIVPVRVFDADPALAPRDVLVMCPDVETYAPLFSAAFGLGEVS